jgi:predicted  nucleic acid-binding Zn-ribbon protein
VVLDLHDVDGLLAELGTAGVVRRLARAGFTPGGLPALERERSRLLDALDRRWSQHYLRAARRYGRAVVRVRERVCLGCFITLPTSAAPGAGEVLTVCESCGRILYWG